MKANGIHQPAQTNRDTAPSSLKRKATADSGNNGNKGKKRAYAEYENQDNNGDDHEGLSKGETEPKEEPMKQERRKSTVVKQEESELPQYDGMNDGLADGMMRYSDIGDHEEDEKGMVGSFVMPGMFEDESESKVGGSGHLGSAAFGPGSAGLGVRGNEAMNDRIVIVD